MLPMIAESAIAVLMSAWSPPGSGASRWNSASEISAAAPPPTPLGSGRTETMRLIFGADQAERAAHDHAEDDLPVAVDALLQERHDDRDEHPGGADLIAAARGGRVRQEPQRQDERHDRDQIEKVRNLATQP